MTTVLLFILLSFVLSALAPIYGWFEGKAHKPIADAYNKALKMELEQERLANEEKLASENRKLDQRRDELEKRLADVEEMRQAFSTSFVGGRRWLARYIAEADRAEDEAVARWLTTRNRPAIRASELVAEARSERRAVKERLKFLEYQLASYKEYFPFLEEYEEVILDEGIPLTADGGNQEALEAVDPVCKYIPLEDFNNLPVSERNQRALDRYLSRNLNNAEIGRFYERFLGWHYESRGWDVEYHGILQGREDMGRDLICRKNGRVLIVQAKNWGTKRLIHEKHIFQLYGTVQLYLMDQEQALIPANVKAIFVTAASLSPVAQRAAKWLGIKSKENYLLDKSYPMIKCNINQATNEKIYHLPFDQQYDRTKIIPALGECYVSTVAEAEKRGFRRAFRHVKF
jgi:Tfp pilus assembly protein PilO